MKQFKIHVPAGPSLNLFCGDITDFSGDVIVNAANQWLQPGGGVDGAIREAASLQSHAFVRGQGIKRSDPFHDACESAGYLPYGHILKVAVPSEASLAFDDCYMLSAPPFNAHRKDWCRILTLHALEQCFLVAEQDSRANIFFPSIGTGVYNVSPIDAAEWFAESFLEYAQSFHFAHLLDVNVVLFDLPTFYIYRCVLSDAIDASLLSI